MVTKTYRCDICQVDYEYEEWDVPTTIIDGISYRSAEELPDGYFLPNGMWICDECGSCPNCGTTLEKEPDKRAHMVDSKLYPAQPCDSCVDENCEFCGRKD
jgi:hypothetical protein